MKSWAMFVHGPAFFAEYRTNFRFTLANSEQMYYTINILKRYFCIYVKDDGLAKSAKDVNRSTANKAVRIHFLGKTVILMSWRDMKWFQRTI